MYIRYTHTHDIYIRYRHTHDRHTHDMMMGKSDGDIMWHLPSDTHDMSHTSPE